MPPAVAEAIAAEPFVEAITPYRPAMKVSPRLRSDVDGSRPEPGGAALDRAQRHGGRARAGADQRVLRRERGGRRGACAHRRRRRPLGRPAHGDRAPRGGRDRDARGASGHRGDPAARLPGHDERPRDDDHERPGRPDLPRRVADRRRPGRRRSSTPGSTPATRATMHADLNGRVTIVSSPNQFSGSATAAVRRRCPRTRTRMARTSPARSRATARPPRPRARRPFRAAPRPQAHVHFTAVGQQVTWKPDVNAAPWGLYGIPADPTTLFTTAYAAGARIHTNSWGDERRRVEGTYDAQARAVDNYMFTHRDALVLFSAGNNGRDANGNVQIDADSIGTPGTAKNVLTVGATENDRPDGLGPGPGRRHQLDRRVRAALRRLRRRRPSLRRPGRDRAVLLARPVRRRPPEAGGHGARHERALHALVGPQPGLRRRPRRQRAAVGRRSAAGPAQRHYCFSGGTSMSTPLVAGAAALVREHLVAQRGARVTPSGALMKAFLVNGARGIAGQFPGEVPAGRNNVTGFGRVDLGASLAPGVLGRHAVLRRSDAGRAERADAHVHGSRGRPRAAPEGDAVLDRCTQPGRVGRAAELALPARR